MEDSLQESGFAVIEMGGVQPNPRMGFVRDTIDWVRDQGIRAVVAVGGGSVIDTAKAVAAGLEYEGDAWDFFAGRAQVEWALPVFAVLTIPAAGSEQSIRAVITHHGTKTGIGSEHIRPKGRLHQSGRFLTLPAIHISAGVCDMLSHICERYFSNTAATDFVDGQAEAALRTIIKFGPKVLADPSNYDAWCQIGLAGSLPTTASSVLAVKKTGRATRLSTKSRGGTNPLFTVAGSPSLCRPGCSRFAMSIRSALRILPAESWA